MGQGSTQIFLSGRDAAGFFEPLSLVVVREGMVEDVSYSDGDRLPMALKAVIALFLLHGTLALMAVLMAYAREMPTWHWGVGSLAIGVGLWLRVSWARMVAIVLTIALAVVCLVFAAMVVNGVPASITWFGFAAAEVSRVQSLLGLAVVIVVMAWQLEVLTRPAVAHWFAPRVRA